MVSLARRLYFVTRWFDVDAFALTVCTMMGLALGVDYALLMVSRFREELAGGAEPMEAALRTRRTAGRTTVFAGSTLLPRCSSPSSSSPASLLASLAGDRGPGRRPQRLVATIAGPAVLALLGPNVDRWRIGAARHAGERSGLMAIVGAALRRPVLVGARDRRRRAALGGAGDRAEDRPAQRRTALPRTTRPARTPN